MWEVWLPCSKDHMLWKPKPATSKERSQVEADGGAWYVLKPTQTFQESPDAHGQLTAAKWVTLVNAQLGPVTQNHEP